MTVSRNDPSKGIFLTIAMSWYLTLARTMNKLRGFRVETSAFGIASSELALVLGLLVSNDVASFTYTVTALDGTAEPNTVSTLLLTVAVVEPVVEPRRAAFRQALFSTCWMNTARLN